MRKWCIKSDGWANVCVCVDSTDKCFVFIYTVNALDSPHTKKKTLCVCHRHVVAAAIVVILKSTDLMAFRVKLSKTIIQLNGE